jgi:hypothetical protein
MAIATNFGHPSADSVQILEVGYVFRFELNLQCLGSAFTRVAAPHQSAERKSPTAQAHVDFLHSLNPGCGCDCRDFLVQGGSRQSRARRTGAPIILASARDGKYGKEGFVGTLWTIEKRVRRNVASVDSHTLIAAVNLRDVGAAGRFAREVIKGLRRLLCRVVPSYQQVCQCPEFFSDRSRAWRSPSCSADSS